MHKERYTKRGELNALLRLGLQPFWRGQQPPRGPGIAVHKQRLYNVRARKDRSDVQRSLGKQKKPNERRGREGNTTLSTS